MLNYNVTHLLIRGYEFEFPEIEPDWDTVECINEQLDAIDLGLGHDPSEIIICLQEIIDDVVDEWGPYPIHGYFP